MPSNLFVIGAARSGTTIVTSSLNSSEDICLLGEANLHYHWETKAFVHTFNTQHRQAGRLIGRGTFLPKSWIGLTARETVDELRKTFSIVGSKIAFPPFRDMPNSWSQDDALNFQMQHFYGAQYLFLFREPLTCCLSTLKLFRKVTPNDIVASWLRSLAFLVVGAQTFPNYWIVPTSWIDANFLRQIETLLDKRLHANVEWLVEPKTAPATSEAGPGAEFCDSLILNPDAGMTGRQFMETATEIYDRLVGWIDRPNLRFQLPGSSIAALEKGVMVTLGQLMSSLAGTALPARNFFSAPDNLLSEIWQRGALSVESRVPEGTEEPPVFVLREQLDKQHKYIMQRLFLRMDQPITFSVEVRPEGRSRCALQIGEPGGHSLAIFDLSACSLVLIHEASGILVVDAQCRRAENGWILCSFSCKPTIPVEYHVSLYLIDDNDRFDFTGSGNDGISVRSPKIETITWPIL